jgi:hypothetical protein
MLSQSTANGDVAGRDVIYSFVYQQDTYTFDCELSGISGLTARQGRSVADH